MIEELICYEQDFLGSSLRGIAIRFKGRCGRSSVVAIGRRPVEGQSLAQCESTSVSTMRSWGFRTQVLKQEISDVKVFATKQSSSYSTQIECDAFLQTKLLPYRILLVTILRKSLQSSILYSDDFGFYSRSSVLTEFVSFGHGWLFCL